LIKSLDLDCLTAIQSQVSFRFLHDIIECVLHNASVQALTSVDGIGKVTAKKIREVLDAEGL